MPTDAESGNNKVRELLHRNIPADFEAVGSVTDEVSAGWKVFRHRFFNFSGCVILSGMGSNSGRTLALL